MLASVGYISLASVGYAAPATTFGEYISPEPVGYAAPATTVGVFFSPAPVGYAAPATTVGECIAPTPSAHAASAAPAPFVGYIALGSAVSYGALAPMDECVCMGRCTCISWEVHGLDAVVGYISLAPVGYAAPATAVEIIAPAPAVSCVAFAPVDEYMALAPIVGAAPAPVIEDIS